MKIKIIVILCIVFTGLSLQASSVWMNWSGGTYSDGMQMGVRNGSILVKRVLQKTIGVDGCRGKDDLMDGLTSVIHTIRPSPLYGTLFSSGFFQGYLQEIRKAIGFSHQICGFSSEKIAQQVGSLYGSFLCQVNSVDREIFNQFYVKPLNTGWSQAHDTAQAQCKTQVQSIVQGCMNEERSDQLQIQMNLSCLESSSRE
ncbi:MAG: hypothetical protein CL678_12125 [Bdellovibrionaceae bacterium]|nr:hypothetical protein [Pseudobdellovibrionaceae bacterium]